MPSRKLPEIRIKNAYLLRRNVSKHLHELWGKDKELVSHEWVEQRVKEYRQAWQPLEQQILEGMIETIGLSFRLNIIDAHIAPWFHAFNDPLIIGTKWEPYDFVNILTHELIHTLLTDNTAIPYTTELLPVWEKLFGEHHARSALIHIPVHAIHKAIYLDVLHAPERLERDIAANKEYRATDFVAAWDYVDKNGYKEIIQKLRESYADLKNQQTEAPHAPHN